MIQEPEPLPALTLRTEGGQNTGWMAWRQELSKMTSGGPGQCPGIWDSGIHKDMVTLERYTEAGGRVWKACAST